MKEELEEERDKRKQASVHGLEDLCTKNHVDILTIR